MQFPVKPELHSSGSAAGEPQNQFQMFSLPVLAGRDSGQAGRQRARAPILRVPLLQPLTGLTGLFRESAVSTWALALATTSHSAVRACRSELATCCEQEKPSLCSSRSKSKIGLEKSVRWAGKEASCRGPWGSQKQHQRLSPPSSIGSGGASQS